MTEKLQSIAVRVERVVREQLGLEEGEVVTAAMSFADDAEGVA